MTVLSPVAKAKFFDNNGAPAAGYKLFTYSAGTTTKLATYTDSTGGTPNANPIVLDFRGEANLWIPPNVSYKYTFASPTDTDPPSAPIWTIDNIVNSQIITLYGGVDTGIANAYVLNFTANFTGYTDGIVIYWIPSHTNTGASTMNVNGLGVVPIKNPDGTDLYLGQIQVNQFACIIYSGGVFKLYTFGLLPKINTQNANYTLAITDAQGIVQASSAGLGGYTWTIPANSTTGFPVGTSIDLINNSSGDVTIAPAVGVTITGYNVGGGGAAAGSLLIPFTNTASRIVKVATDAWQVVTSSWQRVANSFTGTLTGMTAGTSGQIDYIISPAGMVTLSRSGGVASLTGISNSTSMTLTGLPAAVRPKFTALAVGFGILDNGNQLGFVASISSSGVVTFLLAANPPANFTAAGTKGLSSGWQMTYQVI